MSKQIGKIEISIVDKRNSKKSKSKKKTSKVPEKKILKNFLVFIITLLNVISGAQALSDMNEVYKNVKKDIPDSTKSKQTVDAMKDIVKIVAKQHKTDVFSIVMIAHGIIQRVKEAYLVIAGRNKLTTKELKMLSAEALMSNLISNVSNYLMKNKMVPWAK